MTKRKKIGAVILALILAVAMIGCSSGSSSAAGGSNGGSVTNSTSGKDSGGSSNASSSDKKPVTFTYFNAAAHNPDTLASKTAIGKELQKQTGVDWKLNYLVGNMDTKIGTMIASNSYPDVLVPDKDIDKILKAKAFIPLNKLIDKYGPNIKKVYGPFYNQMKAADGNIYYLPFSAQVGKYIPSPTIGQGAFWIQRRVLKAYNYPKIKTLQQYFDLIKKYVNDHSSENLIGFTSLTYDWRFFDLTNPPNHLDGYPNDGSVIINMKTHQADDYANDDITKRWLKALNTLNAEGLYDKSSFVNNYDQYLARLTSGKVLGYFDYGWQAQQATDNLRKAGNDDLRYFPLPIVFDKNIKDQYIDPPSFVNNRGIGITVSAKDPVRIIKYWNAMLSPKNQTLVQWGIKGKDYEVGSDGRFSMNQQQIANYHDQNYLNKEGYSYFNYAWPMYAASSTLPDGNAVAPGNQPQVAQASFTQGTKDILSKYGVKTYSEMFAAPDNRPWYPAWGLNIKQGSPADVFNTKRTNLAKEYFPRMVLAKPNDFDKIWKQYTAQYNKLNSKAYEDTVTKLVKTKIKEVTGNAG